MIPDIWSPLNEEQREFLANHFTLQNYKKNEIIHCEGETPTNLMCLLNGKVKIYKDGVGGRSQIIRMIKPTEYFGYRPYFAKKADYVTAACAFEPSLVCLIPMTAVMTLLSQNNELAMFFIRQLSIDLGIADERTVKPHPKTYPRPTGRISHFSQRKLWPGRGWLHIKYLSVS